MYKKSRAVILQSATIRGCWRLTAAARRAVAAVNNTQNSPHQNETCVCRQLLVDVSIIAAHDAGTGIQRVVRSLLLELLRSPPAGFEVRPVRATRKTSYRYANTYLSFLRSVDSDEEDGPVSVNFGDIFLGLDLSSRILPSRQRELLDWRAKGVRFAFVVYDLLPTLHPEWFTPRARRSFRRWLGIVTVYADALFCISQSVADELAAWLQGRCRISTDELMPRWFHLGADLSRGACIARSLPGLTLPPHRSVLMVGTVEPRKNHEQVLDAFEELWAEGCDVALVIAGREGWHMARFAQRLRGHKEAGKRLTWLSEVGDEQLAELYSSLGGLIMASAGEGFGLPLVEAAHFGMPILARDLPVFREVAGNAATYFTSRNGKELVPQLKAWLEILLLGEATRSDALRRLSWAESANQLGSLLADME